MMSHRLRSAFAKGLPLVVFTAVTVAAGQAVAQTPARPARTQERNRPTPVAAEAYVPTAFPDRVILTVTADPAHNMAVSWRTDTSVTKAMAEIARADHGPQFEAEAKTAAACTTPLSTKANQAQEHSVIFEGLAPNTKYLYRVGDGTHWSEWACFQTASEKPEPFRFLYVGDAQNSLKSHWSRVIRAAFAAAPDARFIVHAGDLVDHGTDDINWGEWFQAAGWINTNVPSLPSPGNHEYERPREERTPGAVPAITEHWRAQFALPQNGPAGLEETAYYIDYQGARIICLNSNEGQEKQAEWLHQILGKNPSRWTIVTFHHPIYSSAKERDNAKIRRLWQPIFDKYHVDLVLQGHDHTYARTGLENHGLGRLDDQYAGPGKRHGLRQLGLRPEAVPPRSQAGAEADGRRDPALPGHLHQWRHAPPRGALRLGDLYDAFTLKKRPGQPNELFEQGPGTPERHPQIPAEKPKAPSRAAALND